MRKRNSKSRNIPFHEGFVPYPPEGTFSPGRLPTVKTIWGHIPGHPDAALNLHACRIQFKKTRDPLSAMEAFVVAHKAEVYPPIWAINWLAESVETFWQLKGKKSFDEIWKLKQPRFTIVESSLKEMKAKNLVREVSKLIALDTDREAAFNAVAKKEKALTETTLKRKFYEFHGNDPDYLKMLKEILLSRWSPEEIQQFKDSYLKYK